MGHRLVCLLPARNAALDLPGFLASAARLCDAVVALDDGSTDETADLLAAAPLVATLLRNPRREDYRGWDDAANRNRLLAAAAALEPDWILSLDADERIDDGDAAALLAFLDTDALPGCAYGFRHVPMRGDADHFVPRYQWVWRLFAFAAGQRFPDTRLHFAPVPTAIPRARWFRTTLRIQHLGGMTDGRRLARFAKYLEADPARAYQADYAHLLRTPADGELRRWAPRPAGLPVLLNAAGPNPDDDEPTMSVNSTAAGEPAITAIVIAQNDEATIARTVASVVDQKCAEPVEVIVVASGADRTAQIVRAGFPSATVVELPRPALPGEARNAGLRLARGTIVSFPGSHVELAPGSLAARLAAHRRGYAMVTGVAVNGTEAPAGWASYFLDHHEGLPGHPPAELNGPPAHCSYARLPLLEAGGFPEGVRTGEDTAVNRTLVRRGYVALRDPAVRFVHRSPCRTPWRLVRHHFVRGRGWGRLLVDEHRERGTLLGRDVVRARLVRHVPDRLDRIRRNVARAEPDLTAPYRRTRPLIAAGAVASWAGMWFEVLRPTPGKWAILVGRPVWTLVVVADQAIGPVVTLLRLDGIANRAQVMRFPPEFPVINADKIQPLGSALVEAARVGNAVDRGERARRVRSLVHQAANVEVDDFTIAPARHVIEPLADLVLGTAAPDGAEPTPRARIPSLQAWASVIRPGADSSLNLGDRLALAARLRRLAADRIAIVDVATAETGRAPVLTAGPEDPSIGARPNPTRRRREAWWP